MTRRRKGHAIRVLGIHEYKGRRKNGWLIFTVPRHLWVWDEPPLKRYPKKPKLEVPPDKPDSEPDPDPKPDP
jgi:hypothetical protein